MVICNTQSGINKHSQSGKSGKGQSGSGQEDPAKTENGRKISTNHKIGK